ncbi:MAG TPA: hypothetical protein VGP26_24590 [Actinophytocola sp.]|nr:hypothetical protein [Actinophytocola sp.]
MDPWYCTREQVKAALDSKETARNNGQVDRAIGRGARSVDEQMHRRDGGFFPTVATRYFDWPTEYSSNGYRLWLDEHELIELTSIEAGGTAISGYLLEPRNDGPPYSSVDINRSTSDTFMHGDIAQRRMQLVGVWGFWDRSEPAGALAAVVGDETTRTVTVTDSAAVGVGQLIKVDSERMTVTAKSMVDTGQNLGADLGSTVDAETVAVGSGAAFTIGEVVLVGAEKMLIVEIAGDNLIVKRKWDGSTLAAHTTGADVYAPRQLTVERGVRGTAAAAHSTAVAVVRQVVPDLIRDLNIAEALVGLQQENAGYGRVIGSGDAQREASGKGLEDLRVLAYAAYGRKVF